MPRELFRQHTNSRIGEESGQHEQTCIISLVLNTGVIRRRNKQHRDGGGMIELMGTV